MGNIIKVNFGEADLGEIGMEASVRKYKRSKRRERTSHERETHKKNYMENRARFRVVDDDYSEY